MTKILLIEDDQRLAELVKNYLGEAGFHVAHAPTGGAGIALAHRDEFDALILDLMLPDIDGLDVCRRVRTRTATPILMLTARGDAMDRVVGLEIGADDYLPKPFERRELLARVKALLRRRGGLRRAGRRSIAGAYQRGVSLGDSRGRQRPCHLLHAGRYGFHGRQPLCWLYAYGHGEPACIQRSGPPQLPAEMRRDGPVCDRNHTFK